MVQISELSREEDSLNSVKIVGFCVCVSLYNKLERKRETVGTKRESTRLGEGKSKQDESTRGEGGGDEASFEKEKTR